MYRIIIFLALLLPGDLPVAAQQGSQLYQGFFDFRWDPEEGKILVRIEGRTDEEFLYVNGLSSGVGSNDIGLDRNQLGRHRIVRFIRSGPKILLVEQNYDYRAVSDNPREIQAVDEAFAKSVIWGFKILEDDPQWIDLTPFLLRDAHGVAARLAQSDQGTYSLDESRSAIHMERTKNFPDNTELDAWITFTGEAKGSWIRSVTPEPGAVTVRMHHAFIRLPDAGFKPRKDDARSGFISIDYHDYATPIDEPLTKRIILRHRLEKRDPAAQVSEAVEPIVYYVDPGCPEPVKSALIDGAQWWDQAFQAAGYRNAFQVRELPPEADPMDIRYNVINWVHRSTRGWSYGGSVYDPRTGEIIKGHVLLGSLRVRQDFLIAQGLAGIFEQGDEDPAPLVRMALARLRQLSAHEVGHALGLMHNFAASYNNRASVMDYPHPYVTISGDTLDLSDAYATGIGEWDKRTILYGYQDFPGEVNVGEALDSILRQSVEMGLKYISDRDARPPGGAHPYAHLWDNGTDPVAELRRLSEVRAHALDHFGENVIPSGRPMAYLEQVLVPVYLAHRYQVEAVAKLIGGVGYSYQIRHDNQQPPAIVPAHQQQRALEALLQTLTPQFLTIDRRIAAMIPPQPAGYEDSHELFKSYQGLLMDPLAAAEGAAAHTLRFLLHPERLARIYSQGLVSDDHPGMVAYLDVIVTAVRDFPTPDEKAVALRQMVEKLMVIQLLSLAGDKSIQQQVSATALHTIADVQMRMRARYSSLDGQEQAHALYVIQLIDDFRTNPDRFALPEPKAMPPGSPIGCEAMLFVD